MAGVERTVAAAEAPPRLAYDARQEMDGLALLGLLGAASARAAFFDPQYRGVLDKLRYGNEGVKRGQRRSALRQMDDGQIGRFIAGLDRVLVPSGHLFLWLDKYHLCTGTDAWLAATSLTRVDLLTWDKGRMGMGYRTRRSCEYLLVLQKPPLRAKGVWTDHALPDVWSEKVKRERVHPKPVGLQTRLIEAVTAKGDLVVDPAAGTFSVLAACQDCGRRFVGCDLEPR